MEKYQTKFRKFDGTIIDLESDGEPFDNYLNGIRKYSKHSATSFGLLNKDSVEVIAKTYRASNEQFIQEIEEKLKEINHPFYAFNAEFDMALLSKLLGREIIFEGEIMVIRAKKEMLARQCGIPNFDDPFNGDGYWAGVYWKKHLETREEKYVREIMAHNRACVLKEFSLMLFHGYKLIDQKSCPDFFEGKTGIYCIEKCERI